MKGCDDEYNRRNEKNERWNQYYRDFDKNLSHKMKEYEDKYHKPKIEKNI